MYKAIIVDDEDKARENLKFLLEEYCKEVQVLDMAGTIDDAVLAIEKHKPQCVFLDIKMRGEMGFDLLDRIPNPGFEIIFTTAYDEYAIKAFKMSAVDYILKPIDIEELKNAVAKLNKLHLKTSDEASRMDVLLDNLKAVKVKPFSKLALPTLDGLYFIEVNNIIRCESDENYTRFFLTNGEKKLVSKTIKYFEELLPSEIFYRTHRSHLINLNHMKEYVKGEGGYIKMSDGAEIMISRRKRDHFVKRISP